MAKFPPVSLDAFEALERQVYLTLDATLDAFPDVWNENQTREWIDRVLGMMLDPDPPAAIDLAIAYRLGDNRDPWDDGCMRHLIVTAARDARLFLLRHERNPETTPDDGRALYVALIIEGALRGDMPLWLAWASLNAARGSMRAVATKEYGVFMAAQRQARERSEAAKARRQDARDRAWHERAAAMWEDHGRKSMRRTATILATEDREAGSPYWQAYTNANPEAARLNPRKVEADYAEIIRKALAKIEKGAAVPT